MVTKRISLHSTDEAVSLFGELDTNITSIEKQYSVQIFIRHANGGGSHWPTLMIRGAAGKVDKACSAVEDIREQIKTGNIVPLHKKIKSPAQTEALTEKDVLYTSAGGKAIRARSPHQDDYIKAMQNDEMVVAIGPVRAREKHF